LINLFNEGILMSFFISDAVAATGAPAQGSPMSLILMLVVFGLIFYFMILRPQQKRTKVHHAGRRDYRRPAVRASQPVW